MRICFLSDPRYLHTQRWARYLAAQGHELLIIGGPADDRPILPGITTCPLNADKFRGPWMLKTTMALRRLLAEFRPDILHMHYLGPLVAPVLLRFHPFLVSVWGADILGDVGLVKEPPRERLLKRIVLRRADAVLASSSYLASATAKYAGLPVERVPTYFWGVDRQQFAPRHLPNGDAVVISFVKHLLPKYGGEYLLQAIPEVRTKHPRVRVLMIGDGPLRPALHALVAELGIADIVSFCGRVAHEDVPHYLARTDIFVMPSVYESETFGVAAVEAQAMGIPVVATRVGGVPEAVADGQTGLLVPPRDPGAIASALIRLIEDSSLRESLSKEGPAFVAKHYDWATNAGKVEHLYMSMLGSSARRSM